MLTSQQLDISSRFRVNQIPPLNVKGFAERSLLRPSITEYNLNFPIRCLMKAGKSSEFNLKLEVTKLLYGAIFYWQCLALAGRGRAGSRLVVWLPWPAGRLSGSQLIQTRLCRLGSCGSQPGQPPPPPPPPPSYHQSSPTVESGNIQRHLHHLHHHHQRTEKNI